MDAKGQRIVIATGGAIGEWALEELQSGDLLVGADRGALFLVRHGLKPLLALGDFDSVSAEELKEIRAASTSFQQCDPIDKDWTDTEMAVQWALGQKPREIVLLGALGTRFDHSLANVHLLLRALQEGVACRIADKHNDLQLVGPGQTAAVTRGRFPQVSLLPLSAEVTGITLDGFQYPLNEASLQIGQSLGISNVLIAEVGHIRIRSGWLLVIQSSD